MTVQIVVDIATSFLTPNHLSHGRIGGPHIKYVYMNKIKEISEVCLPLLFVSLQFDWGQRRF